MKELTEKELKDKYKSSGYPKECFDESHNCDNCLDKNTKLVIIGTMTPKGFDYYYCSNGNKIYGYIDDALETNLKELKIQLNSETDEQKKEQCKRDIIKVLRKNKIAFIDIMKYVLRKKGKAFSHDDSDIEYYSVDKKIIEDLNNKEISIICNSKLCEKTTRTILNTNITYLPQRGKGSNKKIWLDEISNSLGIKKN